MTAPSVVNRTSARFTTAFQRALQRLAEALDISDSHYEAAERSYRSVSEWLRRPNSTVARFEPTIYSQGSFRLGTVTRPLSDEDYFDLDIVSEVDVAKEAITQEQLKNAIGHELAEYAKAHSMALPEPEQYCWTMLYAESAQFRMDVVPAVPDAAYQRTVLEAQRLDTSWVDTAIGLTNTKHSRYAVICRDWNASNPRGYANWFRSRMQIVFAARRRAIALAEGKSDIEQIPEYRVKTPLQGAVQILKRHCDGTFADRPDSRPASVIITTLAAQAYEQEENLPDALANILARMHQHIHYRDGRWWIPNPTDTRENFADRWAEDPSLKESFDEWLRIVRADFAAAATLTTDDNITECLAPRIGRGILERANARAASVPQRSSALARILNAPHKQALRWPVLQGNAFVKITSATASRRGFRTAPFGSNGPALAKHCSLRFDADTSVQLPYEVYWQVVNTGREARDANGLRGTFELAYVERGRLHRNESTLYSGTHSIECFVVKNGFCVAQSGPFIVNIL